MQPTTPAPLLFSEPMPNEKKHENGEGGEDDRQGKNDRKKFFHLILHVYYR